MKKIRPLISTVRHDSEIEEEEGEESGSDPPPLRGKKPEKIKMKIDCLGVVAKGP